MDGPIKRWENSWLETNFCYPEGPAGCVCGGAAAVATRRRHPTYSMAIGGRGSRLASQAEALEQARIHSRHRVGKVSAGLRPPIPQSMKTDCSIRCARHL